MDRRETYVVTLTHGGISHRSTLTGPREIMMCAALELCRTLNEKVQPVTVDDRITVALIQRETAVDAPVISIQAEIIPESSHADFPPAIQRSLRGGEPGQLRWAYWTTGPAFRAGLEQLPKE